MSNWGIDLPIFLGVYLLGIILVGIYSYRKKVANSKEDFFTASKALGYLVLGFSLFATITSGNTFVGFSAEAYRNGLSFLVAPAFYVGVLLALLIVAIKFIPLSSKNGWSTPGDFFTDRFGSKQLTLILILVMFWGTFVQFFNQAIAIGRIGSIASGGYIPYSVAAAIFMGVVIFVMTIGGFRGTALANFIMGSVMIFSMIGLIFFIIPALGGTTSLTQIAQASPEVFSLSKNFSPVSWLSNLILITFGILSYFQIFSHFLGAKDVSTWRKTYIYAPIVYVLIPAIFVIVGVIGIAVFPNLSAMESENIVPLLLNEAASKSSAAYVFGEILIIAVVAATLSTAGVVIFALGQILAQDIYIKFVNPKATESRTILVSKVLMIGLAILGYIIVMSPRLTIWRWIELKFEIGMQAVPAIIFGLYLPWINKKGVGAGIAVGVITVVVLTLLGLPKIGGFHSGVIGFIINVILVLIISYITQKEGEVRKAEDIISETSI